MNESVSSQAILIDNTYYSIGFPKESWDTLISRDNYISQIVSYLANETKILFIEGDEDAGKTTLCAQFARKYVEKTVSVFFNPHNILDYKLDFLYSNLVIQIKNLLNENMDTDETESYYGIEKYRHYIFQLRKKLKKEGECINLIIDGIENKVKEDSGFIKELFDIIPFGENIFRIIISGNLNDYISICPKLKKQNIKSITLAGFSLLEINKYLEINDSTSNEINDLFKVTNGFPGRLKTLKRLIKNENYTLDKIDKTTTYKYWLELDCGSVDLSIPLINGILSLISLNDQLFQNEDISKICSITLSEANSIISNLNVIEYNGNKVNFVSNAHKRYFANILRGNKAKTEELLIKYYANEDTINSRYELSKLYAQREEWPKIIDMIDEKYLQSILEGTGTLEKVNESLEIGVEASEKLSKYVKMWSYSLQGSIVNELDNYLFWESEIEARISIQDFVGAISIAGSAVLKVDRLRLLALIARRQKELNNKVDEDLITLIQELYKITDISSVGDRIYDIVADLIYAIPNLAIEMIEKSSGNASEKNINDWIIAKLSIAAIDSSLKDEDSSNKTKKLEAVQSLNNPSVRKINRAISFLVGNYTSARVLEEVKKLSDSKERLRLLRLWLNNNHSNIKDVEKVIEIALDELIISTSESTITLDILKELSFQLPYVKNIEIKKALLKRFQNIENDLHDLGLSKNKYIYQLNIFHTIYSININDSIDALNSIINEIEAIEDTLIKLESYAEVYSKLKILKEQGFLDKLKFAYSRILNLSEELFKSTANHYKISHYLLETVSRKNPILGLKICERINTLFRREKARLLVLDSYLDNNLKFVNIELLKEIEIAFEISNSKKEASLRILERYSDAKSLHFETIKSLLFFINKVDSFQSPAFKLKSHVLSYKIICKNESWKNKLSTAYENKIHKTWSEIEADWERIDNGFIVCSKIAVFNKTFADKIFQESVQLKNGSWIDSKPVAFTYLNSIKLIIRAYYGLLVSENELKKDFIIIEDLINRIPSETEKLNIWTEVGISSYMANRIEISKQIFDNHVLPLLQSLIVKKLDLEPVLHSITLVHIYNPELAIEYLKSASTELQEEVYSNICNFYISKRSPFEIYDKDNILKYSCNFNEISKAINLISLFKTDYHIYTHIENISNAVTNNRNIIPKAQISSIAEKLKIIIETRLPDARNIKHNGYKIIASIKVSLMKKENIDWSLIINEINKISNLSDIVFVKSILIDNIPFEKLPNGSELRKRLMDEIINGLESFNTHYEFVQRVIDISETMYKIDRNRWKGIVNKAFSVSNKLEIGSEIYTSQKNIIDSMYRLDPNFAKELIKTVDREDNSNQLGNLLHDYFETLEVSNKIKNNQDLEVKEKENYKLIVNSVFKALGALNSERINTKKITEVCKFLPIGNKLPLHVVFPIYMYYLGNCAKTYKAKNLTGSFATLHRDNFIEAVNSTNLIQLLSQRKKFNEKSFRNFFIDEEFSSNKTIKPNSREAAFDFIRKWMQDEIEEFIYIVDPYFIKEDIEILKIIKEINDKIEIDILGSVDGQKSNIEEEYKNYWKKLSDEQPPYTNITFCWNPEDNNNKPIHDRWILTKNSGLRMGTSINSLGIKKESELSIMKPNESLNILENTVKNFISRKKKEINNQRLSYKSFNL